MVRVAALSGARGALAPRRLSPRSHRSPGDGAGHLRNPDCLLWATRRQGPLLLNPRGRVTWPRPGLVRAGEAAGGDVAASNGAPQGVELRKAADAIVESLDEVYAEEKSRINDLLEELSQVREREALAIEERTRLEETAEELGSIAVDAKVVFTDESAKLEEMVQAAEEAIQRREAAAQAVAALQVELTAANETLKARLAAEGAARAKVDAGEEGATDGAAAAVRECRDCIIELDSKLALKQNEQLSILRELESVQEQVDEMQNRVVALEQNLANAETLASVAMEASAGGFAAEVETRCQEEAIEKELQGLVKDLRAKELRGEEILDDVARMEELVNKTICEGDESVDKQPEEAPLVKATGKSSKYLASSLFSSGPGSGEPEKAIGQFQDWLHSHRFLFIGGVVGLAAVVGLLNHKYFEMLLEKPLSVAASFLSGLPDMLHNMVINMAPEGAHIPRGVIDMLVLLTTSVIFVPLICKLPGGSPVLGFLAGGAVIGPHALGIVQEVNAVQHLAEFGVVFLLFNIGLELSLDRLNSMRKYVFGLGLSQFLVTTAAICGACMLLGLSGPAGVIVGGAMALSSTAVALQVLQDRGESGSRHGRATFSVLLLQDLAVVALLMLIPLLAPSPDGSAVGLGEIGKALGMAAIKAVVCIAVIISAGRALLRPIFKKIADFQNAEIFAATTLLTCIGTSLLTQVAGLSMALGAFLAGLLLAETEYALQVESDIAPYRGLLLGLFFMTVGMEISGALFVAKWKTILAGITMLIVGKTAVLAAVGPMFGMSRIASIRTGFMLAPGGEFAFVAFGEAVGAGILSAALSNQLFLVVALSMALTPYLAAFGQWLGSKNDNSADTTALLPAESEVDDLNGHVIIAGFGRVGQVIAQVFSERLIPFVALDVRSDRVQAGRALDMPVFFGDAGSPAVLHSVRAEKAACVVVALDTPGANYRTVWAVTKNFPDVKTYVRAHDVDHGINLEKAGAFAVVPEILEPSLQLAAAVLRELKMPAEEVAASLEDFRRLHLSELKALCDDHGSSMGYGFAKDPKDEGEAAKDSPASKDAPAPA
eukprot:jgi/Tetstr1/465747/TSEL_010372.t1